MSRFTAPVLAFLAVGVAAAADWPQWMGETRDGVWAEKGVLETFPEGGPKLVWKKPLAAGYSGPAVAGGLVYVMDYVTDADVNKLNNPANKPKVKGKERVLCLKVEDGSQVWKYEYDCPYEISYPGGPRCTPTVSGGKVYALGAMGNLVCLDAKKGTEVWKKDLKAEPYGAKTPLWGFTGHPVVDGDRLICLVGGKDSGLVAFHKDTGKEVWRALDGSDQGYCPPSIITAGGKRQAIVWLPDGIYSVDPETGKEYWKRELKPNYSMSIMAPQKGDDVLFAGGIGGASLALRLDSTKPAVAEELWRTKRMGKTGLSPVNGTPVVAGDVMYGVDQPGQLKAVDMKTGKQLWETAEPITGAKGEGSGTGFLVKNGDRWFIFNEKGELVIAKLSREKYTEVSRAKLLEPTGSAFGRKVVWSHPAFADKSVFARNDKEIARYSLAK